MKKIYTLILSVLTLSFSAFADSYTITISGVSYTPATLNVVVGDEVTIQASGNHPLRQVSQSNWDANDATQLSGGFGTETTDYTFTVTGTDDIYYVCVNHVSSGMKGKIVVSTATGIEDLPAVTDLMIYPNPVVNGELSIKAKDRMDGQSLEIYNSAGQLVKDVPLTGVSAGINLNLANGVYSAVVVKDNKAVVRKRLVLVRR